MMVGEPLAQPPWGLLISVYFILAGAASGTTLLCWWIRPRDQDAADHFEWLAGLVAFVAIAVCGVILIVDLDRPARFFLMLTDFSNLGSVISVGAKLIAFKAALLALYLFLVHRRREARAIADDPPPDRATRIVVQVTPALLGVASFGIAIYPAFLLSRTWIAPLASTPGAGLVFLCTAMLMGTAIAAIVAVASPRIADDHFRARLGRTLVVLIAFELALLVFEGLALRGTPHLAHAYNAAVQGDAAAIFWGLVVGAGLVVPLVALLALPRHRMILAASCVLVLVGAAATRHLFFTIS